MRKLGLLFLLGLLSGWAHGTTRYVTTSGSDSNPCTLASPCATPTHADSIASAGDTVNVAAGVYSYGGSAAQFNTGGTSGNPITITCATRGACRITNTITGNSTVVYLHAANIVFDGFEVTNTGAGNNLGIYVDVSNVSITRNTIHDIQTDCGSNGGGGVQIAVLNLTNIVIDSNQVYNISWSGSTPKCDSSVVQTDGILSEQTGFSTTTTITNNIVYNTSGGWGILASTNAVIENNTVFNTVNGGIALNNAPSGAVIQNNIIVYTGLLAHNGAFYGGACAIQNGTASSTTYGHNDLFGNHGGNYGTGFGCSGAGLNTGDIAVDPVAGTTFINWQQNGSGDYHEKTGSPTIAAGTSSSAPNHDFDGNPRPSGAGFDMGAYQVTAHQTWYIRPDGGSRWSVNATSGQCNGKFDAAYPGSGTNQNCAFNDYRWLYDDKTFPGTGHWVIAGGDTVLLEGCASGPTSTTPSCRVGSDLQAGSDWCPGIGNAGCTNPPIPAGTIGAHTKILGSNYAACTANSSKQELFGGWGLGVVMNLGSTQYVDIACLNITRHSDCIFFGSPAVPHACNRSFPAEEDYADNGMTTNSTTANVTITDVWDHGFLSRGVIGPIGGPVTATRMNIDTNGGAGWDFDDGSATPMGAGALWTFNNSTIQWSGCNQQYPFVDTIPVASCYSQSTGGYGDAVGTPAGTGLSMSMDHSTFIYNTQDAMDAGHVDTGGPYTLSVTNNWFAHNGGSNSPKFDNKFGTLANPAIVTGNLMLGDGARMSQPITGVPTAFNANLADFCRAGDFFPYNFDTASGALVANNSLVGYCPAMIDNSCNQVSCTSAKSQLYNNIFLGYAFFGNNCGGANPPCAPGFAPYPGSDYGGTNIGPSMFFYQNGGPGIKDYQNNIYYQTRQTCPTGFDNGTCATPLLAGQPLGNQSGFVYNQLDAFGTSSPIQSAWKLSTGSPAIATGITYTQLPTTDIFGNPTPGTPNIGAVNSTGGVALVSITVTPNPASVSTTTTVAMTCTAVYSDSSTGPCISPGWSTSGAHTSINPTTGVVTGITVGSDTIAATIGSIHGGAIVNVTSAPPPTAIISGTVTITGQGTVTGP